MYELNIRLQQKIKVIHLLLHQTNSVHMTHTCLFMNQVSWHFTGLGQIVTTCLECSLLEEQAVSKLLLHPALLLLRPTLRLLLSCWRQQRGHHLFPAQSFPLALLRHLQPKLINHAVVAGPHVSVPDHSAAEDMVRSQAKKKYSSGFVLIKA